MRCCCARLTFAAIHVVALSAEVVDRATEWRVRHGLKASDALQAACALSCLETHFL